MSEENFKKDQSKEIQKAFENFLSNMLQTVKKMEEEQRTLQKVTRILKSKNWSAVVNLN